MQVAVDHSTAGSQAISGRTPPLLSYTRDIQSILGIDPTSFSGHSSRRGATNTTATAGIPTALLFCGRYSIHFPLSQQHHSQPGPPTSASSLSDVFQPSNPLPDSQGRS